MEEYEKNCKKRVLSVNYKQIFEKEIFPILQNFYNKTEFPILGLFCDSVYTSYFQYKFGNDTNNKITLCGEENVTKIYNFCFEYFDSFRGWNEFGAYMFYKLYQHIFKYMNDSINSKSPLKMVMVGGHDVTVDKFMNFLDGLKIIPRTHFPHYACNVVIELRKYENDFFLEFYYNDILKYNNTLNNFRSILDNSKYSNLYNYCGVPSINNQSNQINITNQNKNVTQTNITTNITTINNNQIKTQPNITNNISKINNNQNITKNKEIINKTNIQGLNKTDLNINKTKISEIINETKQIEYNPNNNFNNTYNISTINKTKDIDKIINHNELKNNNYNNTDDKLKLNINNTNNINGTLYTLKTKLKAFFKQENDLNLYIILGSIFISIILLLIIIIIILILYYRRRKKLFNVFFEENSKTNNSIGIIKQNEI